mgnify:CR=1 FL=1
MVEQWTTGATIRASVGSQLDTLIATAHGTIFVGPPYDEMLANARLIAAAPELLEALDRVTDACERAAVETCCCPSCWEHPYGDGSGHGSSCALTAARAAIAKARGTR